MNYHAHTNLLTFDVEEWFMSYPSSQIDPSLWKTLPRRLDKNITDILEFLEKHQQKATFYIMGWVAEHFPESVDAINQKGHEIGYHSYFHHLPEKLDIRSFEKDLSDGISLIEEIIKKKVTLYRAPGFSFGFHTGWAIPVLLAHGIEVSSSVMSGRTSGLQKIPSQPFCFNYHGNRLLEIPLNRIGFASMQIVYTGSGFFRLLPLSLLKRLYSRNRYNMAYFHPRDFDTEVPVTTMLPFYRNIMCRLQNSTTIPKLSELLSTMHFQTVGSVAKGLEYDKLQVINLK